MTVMVIRDWVRRGCWVSTIHPVYGELTRGLITSRPQHRDQQGRMTWSVSDQDRTLIYTLTGDYLDA